MMGSSGALRTLLMVHFAQSGHMVVEFYRSLRTLLMEHFAQLVHMVFEYFVAWGASLTHLEQSSVFSWVLINFTRTNIDRVFIMGKNEKMAAINQTNEHGNCYVVPAKRMHRIR